MICLLCICMTFVTCYYCYHYIINYTLLISDHQMMHSSQHFQKSSWWRNASHYVSYHILNAFSCPCLTGALYQSFCFFYISDHISKEIGLFVGGGQGKGQVHSLLLVLLNCTDKCIIFLTTTTVLYLMQVVLFCLCDKPTIGLCLIFSAYCMVSVCSDIQPVAASSILFKKGRTTLHKGQLKKQIYKIVFYLTVLILWHK